MKYKGYEAVINFDEEDKLFYGEVININDLVAFDGQTVAELEESFHTAVDDYLEYCRKLGKSPDKPFSGRFNVRISPELHRKAVVKAKKEDVSLNTLVERSLQAAVGHEHHYKTD